MTAYRPGVKRLAIVAAFGLVAATASAAAPAGAQIETARQLQDRIQAAGSERISFRYETHDHVNRCEMNGKRWSRDSCWSGPAEVTLTTRDGQVVDLDVEIVRTAESTPPRYETLGTVNPQAAADYLLGLVPESSVSVAEDAIGAASMADDVVVWPRMLEFARDQSLGQKVRSSATFWVGQASADEAVVGLREIVDGDPDSEVRQSAVFALSQHKGVEVISTLIEIAEESDDPEVRRSAFFWLAQHDDDRVLDFFERVLRGNG